MTNENFKYREEIFKKSGILYLFVFLIFIVIILRLLQVMFVQKSRWEKVAKDYSIDLKPGKPERGDIYDDNGNLLATTTHYYDIHMDTRAAGLTDKKFNENIDSLAQCLSDFLKDRTKEQYKKYITDARNKKIKTKSGKVIVGNRYLTIAYGKTHKAVNTLLSFPLFCENPNIGGVIVRKRNIRERLLGNLMRRTIGSVSDETENKASNGIFGLEYTYNSVLTGAPGQVLKRKISNGHWMEVPGGELVETKNGLDLTTSIDIDLQDFVQEALKNQILKFKAEHGSVIVMEVKTGHIKAIANLTLTKDSNLVEDKNYAVAEALEPGSTFKLPVLIAAMEDNLININDTFDTGKGYVEYFGKVIEDEGAYGKIPVWKIFSKSSNVGMARIVYEKYYIENRTNQLLRRFGNMGLMDKTGVDILGEALPFINNPSDRVKWWKGSPMMMSHGYEIKMTPLQILNFYNAVANNGRMVKPSIVKAISSHGETVKVFSDNNELKSSICSQKTLKDVKYMLEKAVSADGTAKQLGHAKYRIAGKTGTAKIYDDDKNAYIDLNRTSFAGYFPADKPKYSCIVVIHGPVGKNMYGSNVAAPVFLKISDKLYSQDLEINPPEENNLGEKAFVDIPISKNGYSQDLDYIFSSLLVNTEKKNTNNSPWIITNTHKNSVEFKANNINKGVVPNVKYMGARDAVFLLESMGLEVKIKGKGFVKQQSISPGKSFNKGDKILIELA